MPTFRRIRKLASARPEGFEAIAGVVKAQLSALEKTFSAMCADIEKPMRPLVRDCLGHRGKRLRPILVFFSGARDAKTVSEPLVRLAAIVEIVHLATLVHDDVMDGARLRHGSPTVNAVAGDAAAVLLGDALFSRAIESASAFDAETVCKPLVRAVRRVCAGEIWQTSLRGDPSLSPARYFEIIEMKTGELFRIACLLGARVGGQSGEICAAFETFGMRLGRAYQIFDDVADIVGDERAIGKTLGTDLKSGKYTLPALLLWRALDKKGKARLQREIAAGDIDARALVRLLRAHGILDAVVRTFRAEIAAARAAVAPHAGVFAADHLLKMADFVSAQLERFCEKYAFSKPVGRK